MTMDAERNSYVAPSDSESSVQATNKGSVGGDYAPKGTDDSEDRSSSQQSHTTAPPSAAVATLQFALDSLATEDFPSFVKRNERTLTFPDKLMLLLVHIERTCAKSGRKEECQSIGWVQDGKSFVIRDKRHLSSTWLPLFFSHSKFSSFTRKLYRWGFRKTERAFSESEVASVSFTNENFQRNRPELLPNMRSITAAKMRSQSITKSKVLTDQGRVIEKEPFQFSADLVSTEHGVIDATSLLRRETRLITGTDCAPKQDPALLRRSLSSQQQQPQQAYTLFDQLNSVASASYPALGASQFRPSSLPSSTDAQAAGLSLQMQSQVPALLAQKAQDLISCQNVWDKIKQDLAQRERDRLLALVEEQVNRERLLAIAELLLRQRGPTNR